MHQNKCCSWRTHLQQHRPVGDRLAIG
jgi:hypothetical protein